eukprot:COSAG01_NODE_1538_length_9984_cov_92.104097_6_plen_206_part_00
MLDLCHSLCDSRDVCADDVPSSQTHHHGRAVHGTRQAGRAWVFLFRLPGGAELLVRAPATSCSLHPGRGSGRGHPGCQSNSPFPHFRRAHRHTRYSRSLAHQQHASPWALCLYGVYSRTRPPPLHILITPESLGLNRSIDLREREGAVHNVQDVTFTVMVRINPRPPSGRPHRTIDAAHPKRPLSRVPEGGTWWLGRCPHVSELW